MRPCSQPVGSAVDNEKDTQNLQLPITIPLLLAFFVMFNAMKDPNGPLAFWFSLIPFTSPVIMMARLPYGVPGWEVIVSVVLLYLTFIGMVWLAGKIYRVGIFMYGKKPTFKELFKWMKYKYWTFHRPAGAVLRAGSLSLHRPAAEPVPPLRTTNNIRTMKKTTLPARHRLAELRLHRPTGSPGPARAPPAKAC